MSATTVSNRSANRPASSAVINPSATAKNIHRIAAPMASENVRGMPLTISSSTLRRLE